MIRPTIDNWQLLAMLFKWAIVLLATITLVILLFHINILSEIIQVFVWKTARAGHLTMWDVAW